ncbi:hypothetical protein [Clostridium fungisolvens]|uniref:Uncharacterized protein n=1 Tax=Clostridium fungisolvens TaxID=1604897 RepID=A0A6V8SRD7_9CLOT|nr:hypothetical protein [Clostridium fungisolvens]GFP77443.1 hypothetical protein bsdtw1_03571 [Clostridium fungisolvens]
MARRDDVNQLYLWPNRIESIIKWLFWINVACSLAGCIIKISTVANILLVVQILASVFYVVLKIIDDNFFWYNAESVRRETAIENGLGIDITEYETNEYYNNDLPNNFMKFSVNAFESIMFSKTTAGRMMLNESARITAALLAFVSTCLVYKDYGIMLVISQTVFSAYFVEEFVTLVVYKVRLEKLYDSFYKELITIGIKSEEQKSLLLAYAIEYEAIKAHYKIRLSQKEFWKHNTESSLKWNQICKKIKVY